MTQQVQLEHLWPVVSRSALVEFIFVDEAQDLTQAQLQYLAFLAKMGMIVIFVGDAMQGIYRFCGAVGVDFVRLANKVVPSGEAVDVITLSLTTCFRCAKVIVAAANLVLIGKANSEQLKPLESVHLETRNTTENVGGLRIEVEQASAPKTATTAGRR